MNVLDLRPGISKDVSTQYSSWVFAGGEVHVKLANPEQLYDTDKIQIISRVVDSDSLMFLMVVVDTIRKDDFFGAIEVVFPYMPYQQADRDFSLGESFSLRTVTNILNSLDVNKFIVFDSHSDVSPALLRKCKNIDTSDVIKKVIVDIEQSNNYIATEKLFLLSPDSGAYKKIGKLCSKIDWKGGLVAANKYRSISTGNIESLELSLDDFEGKDVLIVDDICVGGRTFVELAKKLQEKNVGNLYLYISHGVFSHGFKELNHYFKGIYTTNSRCDFQTDPNFSITHDGEMYKLNVINIGDGQF